MTTGITIRKIGWGAAVGISAALLASSQASAAPSVASVPAPITDRPGQMLTEAQLASDIPKTVVIDTRTGQITSSWLGIPADSTMQHSNTLIASHTTCSRDDGCYASGRIPYANIGFYGTPGTKHGSWPYRAQIASGSKRVKACWGAVCSPILSPRTQAALNSQVTGTSFRIY